MKKKKVSLIRSETWMGDDFKGINSILEDTIKEFVSDERIINIEVKEHCGLKDFGFMLNTNYPPPKNLACRK